MVLSLEAILDEYGIIDIKKLFANVLRYGLSQLGCHAGATFLFDKATRRLKLRASTWGNHKHFSLLPGQGLGGSAYAQKNAYLIHDAARIPGELDFFAPFPVKRHRFSLAMPILVHDQVEAIFCFYFTNTYREHCQGSPTQEETDRINLLWKELRAPRLSRAIHRIQMHSIPGRILAAGQSTARLTTEVSRYISNLQNSFKSKGWPQPKKIYVHLKDASRNLIQTIQGFSTHQKLQISLSHLLSSKDINADIVNNRNVEIISGFDPVRFDHHIFEAHQHDRYSRIWIPLFPFPMGKASSGSIETFLCQIMKWADPETKGSQLVKRKGYWIHGHRPPKEIVYGVLELGYELPPPYIPSLSHWSPGFAMSVMARAYELSVPLYRATLAGVMDRIGRLISNSPVPCKIKMKCLFPNKRRKETLSYPIDAQWPVAVPKIDFMDKKDHNSHDKPVKQLKAGPVSLEFEEAVSLPSTLTSSYLKMIHNQNTQAAGKAMEIAFILYESVMAPFSLVERETDPKNVGTMADDRVVKTLIEDAARSNGALCAVFFSFERRLYSEKERYENAAQSVEWGSLKFSFSDRDSIQILAKRAVRSQSPKYMDSTDMNQNLSFCFLPLKLKEGSTGVIALGFRSGYSFTSETKMDIERQARLWQHRLTLHRLVLRKRFSSLMMRFRREVIQAKEAAVKTYPRQNPFVVFIEGMINSALTHLDVRAAVVSLFQASSTGPSRLRVVWGKKNANTIPVKTFEFFNIETQISCKNVLGSNRLKIISGKDLDHCTGEVVQFLTCYAKHLNENRKKDQTKRLQDLAVLCQESDTGSILMFPIQEEYPEIRNVQGRFYLFMKEHHFFRGIHQCLTSELGQLMGLTMSQVKLIQEENERATYTDFAKERIRKFEAAKSIDEIIHCFLQGLGQRSPEKGKKGGRKGDYLGVTEDAVVWTCDRNAKELVARSGRGSALEALCHSSWDIIKYENHPVFHFHENDLTTPKKGYPVLKGDFKVWTFDLTSTPVHAPCERLFQSYHQFTRRKWLISFLMVDPADKVFGAIDFLRDEPLNAQTESVLKHVFHRLSRRLNSAAEKVRLRRVNIITEDLFTCAKINIEKAKTFSAYNELAKILKKEFHCRQCDLFVKKQGRFYLYASTHDDSPKNERQRALLWFEKGDSSREIFDNCLGTGRPCISHNWNEGIKMENFSENLKHFLAKTHHPERLLLPLKAQNGSDKNTIDGLVQLHCPEKLPHPNNQGKYLKKNNRFSAEDCRLGSGIGLQLRRIIRMLRLAEEQIWLVNEVGHSVAQPLQVMRSDMNHMISTLYNSGVKGLNYREMADGISQSYDMIHEAVNQLSYFTGIHRSGWEFETTDLKQLLVKCCTFMAKTARLRNLNIDYSRVSYVDPLPIEQSWMRKALLNLLHNACKYSWKGKNIRVSMGEKPPFVVMGITNYGIGIPSEDINRIFNAYFRSLVDDTRGIRAGTGIGLPIVKNAIETIHQGEIKVTSDQMSGADVDRSESSEDIVNKYFKTTFEVILNRGILKRLIQK